MVHTISVFMSNKEYLNISFFKKCLAFLPSWNNILQSLSSVCWPRSLSLMLGVYPNPSKRLFLAFWLSHIIKNFENNFKKSLSFQESFSTLWINGKFNKESRMLNPLLKSSISLIDTLTYMETSSITKK